jgi:hypothetical protein
MFAVSLPSDYPMSSPMAQLLQQYDWFAALAAEHRALAAATTQLARFGRCLRGPARRAVAITGSACMRA